MLHKWVFKFSYQILLTPLLLEFMYRQTCWSRVFLRNGKTKFLKNKNFNFDFFLNAFLIRYSKTGFIGENNINEIRNGGGGRQEIEELQGM